MQHRVRLASAYDLRMAPNDVLERILNKQALFEVADSVGIHCPRSLEVSDEATLAAAISSLDVPLVAKPLYSRDWRRPEVRRIVRKNKAFVLQSASSVRELYAALQPLAPQMILQEFVPGADDQLIVFGSYVDRSGVPQAHFTARKALQHPPVCGNGVAIRAEKMPADVTENSLALLDALRYRGVSELEFKRDSRTGRLALIEMNARHWDQHRLSDAVGTSVTRAMYEDWLELPATRYEQSDRRVTLIIEDAWLRGLADAVRGRDGRPGDFLRLLRPPLRGALWDSGDPAPFFSMLSDLRRGSRLANAPQPI
jgi:predicted ATP-grasp superfamily ATP-dependent carboligase